MNSIGNVLWLLLGGILIAGWYFLFGFVLCVTIIGIPFGLQLFKLGAFALWPFGRELVDGPDRGGCLTVVMNIIWILTGWWELAVMHFFFGVLCLITIVGIPFGLQHFKMALASLVPFGKEIKGAA